MLRRSPGVGDGGCRCGANVLGRRCSGVDNALVSTMRWCRQFWRRGRRECLATMPWCRQRPGIKDGENIWRRQRSGVEDSRCCGAARKPWSPRAGLRRKNSDGGFGANASLCGTAAYQCVTAAYRCGRFPRTTPRHFSQRHRGGPRPSTPKHCRLRDILTVDARALPTQVVLATPRRRSSTPKPFRNTTSRVQAAPLRRRRPNPKPVLKPWATSGKPPPPLKLGRR